MVSEEIISDNQNVRWNTVSSTSLYNIWVIMVWIWTTSDSGCVQFWSSARRKLHIKLKNWMVSAQSEDVWNIERIRKYLSEFQYPFRFIVRILITILLRTVTLSSDAVHFSSVTICCTLFTYLPEAWTERPGHISECNFTGGRMFWTVTWFGWG